jgi:hypothetical protein
MAEAVIRDVPQFDCSAEASIGPRKPQQLATPKVLPIVKDSLSVWGHPVGQELDRPALHHLVVLGD